MSDKTIGQIGFDAYGDAAGWKTFDGRPMPTWEELKAQNDRVERLELALAKLQRRNDQP